MNTCRPIVTFCFLLLLNGLLKAGFFEDANRFFAQYVEDGLVGYGQIHEDPSQLNRVVAGIAKFDLGDTDKATQKAFYVNAYNILMIKSVIDHYPVGSPLEIKGVFDKLKHKVAGKLMTLDDIEKGILLKDYFDPRLHFVLVCGARDCPPLASYAFEGGQLDRQLDARTRLSLNDPGFTKVFPAKRKVGLSMIFKWYKDDFLRSHKSLLSYVNNFREEAIPASYQVVFYEYDWSLNAAGS